MMVVIGSLAMAFRVPLYEERKIADTDIVGTYDEIVAYKKVFGATTFYPFDNGNKIFMRNKHGAICEADIAWPDSAAERLLEFVLNEDDTVYNETTGLYVPSLDVLYMLKHSHKYLKDSPHFLKTMDDIIFMRDELGCKIRPEHEELLKQREKDTYTYNLPKLNVSKSEFFDSEATGVYQKYLHDDIHEAVKHLERPAYTYFKEDQSEVFCSRELFFQQPEIVRLYSVVEEAQTLAIERSLVPYPGKKTPKEAFDMGLMKCCTSIASGFWREYAYENYYKVQELYNDNYVDKFQESVQNGVVRLKEEA